MEEILNYIAAVVLASPLLVLLAIPVVFVGCALVIALADLTGWAMDLGERLRAAWSDFRAGYRNGLADFAARHPR